jgi:signal transduction histidine kinase
MAMKFTRPMKIITAVFSIIFLAILDYVTGYETSFSIFYLAPIILLTWHTKTILGIISCFVCAILWTSIDLLSGHPYSYYWIPLWNGLVRLGFFIIVSIGVSILKRQFEIQKVANEELKRLSRAKSDFTSMVSHELRTPLTVIKESIRIVHGGMAGAINSEQEDFLATAKRNIDRLARLINDVLDFQKLESKKAEIHMMENDINELVNEIKESFVPMAKNNGLELATELEKALPPILLDRDKIMQVMTNLVSNALKVMEKGKITLKTKLLENAVCVSVEDQGPGIKEEDLPKLFQPFSQLAAGSKRKLGSTGLGLAISKEIVEEHKGKIGVESAYGKGSTFYFLLPIKKHGGL